MKKRLFPSLFLSILSLSHGMEPLAPSPNLIDHKIIEQTNIEGISKSTYAYTYDHNPAFTPEQLQNIILKGEQIAGAIYTGTLNSVDHRLEHFSHFNDFATRRYLDYYSNKQEAIQPQPSQETSRLGRTISYIPFIGRSVLPPPSDEDIQKEKEYIAQRQGYLENVICFIWHLCDKAYKQGDIFNRGAFVIEDKDQKVHTFLEEYCCFAARVPSVTELRPAVLDYYGSNFAYKRTSSHFKDRSPIQYGIDSRFVKYSFAVEVLPFAMTHILFGRVKNLQGIPLTFVKPEKMGLGDMRSTLWHTFDYFSGGVKNEEMMRREKDIPLIVAQDFFKLLECISKLSQQTQQGIVTEDSKLLDHIIKGEEWLSALIIQVEQKKLTSNTLSILQETKTIDISLISKLTAHIGFTKKIPKGAIKNQSTILFETMKTLYGVKSLRYRTGHEIVFLDSEFMSAKLSEPLTAIRHKI